MNENEILIVDSKQPVVGEMPFELVERKGMGHPDSICDGIVESVCQRLCREYRREFGIILHHNIDKGLLMAGQSTPRLGGGAVTQPMRFIFGDRGVYEYKGIKIPIGDIVGESAGAWFKKNLRFVEPENHVVYQNEIKYGATELVENLLRQNVGANDTSVGVGYAPLSPTEQAVLAVERWLNSASFKKSFPESGEDIKIMGCRRGRHLDLMVAMAFVDTYIQSPKEYFEKKDFFRTEIEKFVKDLKLPLETVNVEINSLDDPDRGDAGMYLTVLGTSAESGDSGQVGRGNRVNGVIAYNRPTTTEAAAGKNPMNHTGKIYNILSHQLAAKIYETVPGLGEVTVWLCSRIGTPIDEPVLAAVEVKTLPGMASQDAKRQVLSTLSDELANIELFVEQLRMGEFSVF